jgi:uncharacterized protein YozE (UPF0346 family)
MRSCDPQQILAAIANAQSFSPPKDEWFDSLPQNIDVFSSLYQWMLDTRRVSADKAPNLHHLTYVGKKLYKRLVAAEKRRIAGYAHLRGNGLQRAVSWSDVNSGPRTEFAHCEIRGELIIVLPDDRETIHEVQCKWLRENYDRQLRKVTKCAAGSNFYEWLVASSDRDDPVGDFARYAIDDIDFPSGADHYIEIRTHFEDTSEEFLGSAKRAWLEYEVRYPDRIRKRAICDDCGCEIYDLSGGLVTWRQFGDLAEVVHMDCRDEDARWKIQLDAPNLGELLHDFADRNAIHWHALNLLEEQLKRFGFSLPPKSTSLVYFMEAVPSGAIKIGNSGSLAKAEQRRKDLQIARHPEILRIKAVMAGDLKLEKELQRRFGAYNLGGEWFAPDPELLEFITTNAYDPYNEKSNSPLVRT